MLAATRTTTRPFADRMEEQVEALAPGFRALIRGRHVYTPRTLEQANHNLVGGALNGGTAQIQQQLVFRPVPGLARAETPVEGLFLGVGVGTPGGGVHGARARTRPAPRCFTTGRGGSSRACGHSGRPSSRAAAAPTRRCASTASSR